MQLQRAPAGTRGHEAGSRERCVREHGDASADEQLKRVPSEKEADFGMQTAFISPRMIVAPLPMTSLRVA